MGRLPLIRGGRLPLIEHASRRAVLNDDGADERGNCRIKPCSKVNDLGTQLRPEVVTINDRGSLRGRASMQSRIRQFPR
jgi:hypothetical protein